MHWKLVVALLAAALCAGCVTAPPGRAWPEPRPLGGGITPFRPAREPKTHVHEGAPLPQLGEELRLRDAVSLALSRSPELAGVALSVREAEAEALQAGLLPNPELEVEFEEFAGTGDLSGTKSAETTISVGQLLELGGKRDKRTRLARIEAELAGWDYEVKRIAVITDVVRKFTGVLAAQRKAELANANLKLAEATRDAVESRVRAGKVSPVELTKANVEVSTAGIRVRRADRELVAARHQLTATWGASSSRFTAAAGNLYDVAPLPELDQILPLLGKSPELARWKSERAQRTAALSSEKAQAIPDVTISAGYRYFNESKDQAALVGISVPLPLFDRNQGGIRKARYGLLRAHSEEEAAWARLRAELLEAYQELASAREEATTLRVEVVPAVEQAFEASRKSFDEGKTDYLDVLDAQRTLTDAREKYIDALASYHQALAAVEGLIAQPLSAVNDTQRTIRKETGND